MTAWLTLIAVSFLLGSVPTGHLIARARGVDIRRHGSGNIGATNVMRVLGPRAGLLCLALDILKGFIPVLGAGLVTGAIGATRLAPADAWWWLAVMTGAVAGHMFSPWMGFRGGKGVATGLGALLGLYPYLTIPAVAALVVWSALVAAFRYVGLSSVIAAACLPVFTAVWGAARAVLVLRLDSDQWAAERKAWIPFLVMTSLMAAFVIVRHRGNIRRTLAGTEPRLGARSGPPRD